MPHSTFATLVNSRVIVPSTSTAYFAVEKHFLMSCLRDYIDAIRIDEDWYLERYPDVAEAIGQGLVDDVRDHYARFGYFEHRAPYPIAVDEAWYVKAYPDVAQAVAARDFGSAQEHFDAAGFQEGRFPYPNFELRTSRPASSGRPPAAEPATVRRQTQLA